MSILTEPLPEEIKVGDNTYPIHTDFRNWIRFDELVTGNKPFNDKIAGALALCYIHEIPADLESALYGAMDFYMGAHKEEPSKKEETGGGETVRRIYSFEEDADYIYAAFWTQYHLDLRSAPLHWWQFQALFQGLEEERKMNKIMEIRAVDLSKIKDKEQKAYYRKMKAAYKLPDLRSEQEKDADIAKDLENFF